MTFKIVTDSTSDLFPEYYEREEVTLLSLIINIDGQSFQTAGENSLTSSVLFKKMEKTNDVSTSAVSSGEFEETFMQLTNDNSEVLYLAFSSGLSGTYQAAVIAREMLLEKKPNVKIAILDTLAASSGEGYLVEEAVKLRNSGKTLSETVKILTDLKMRLRSWFMVDDLQHLARGGRIPKASAFLGSIASIKPVLDIDAEGKLRQVSKVRGNKRAINSLINESLNDFDENYPRVIITQAEAEETAESIRQQFLSVKSNLTVDIYPLGPVIAAHTGPGTISIFTVGKKERV